MREDIKDLSRRERYSLFLNHILGSKVKLLEEVAHQKTLGEVLVIVAYLNAVLVTQLSQQEITEFSQMVMDFGQMYPQLLHDAGIPPSQIGMVVPIIEGVDYSTPPNLEDYLTPDELRATVSIKATPKEEAKNNPLIVKPMSNTIQ